MAALIRPHISVYIMFYCMHATGTLTAHSYVTGRVPGKRNRLAIDLVASVYSGYNIPFLYNALEHDWHHYSYTEMFGTTGWLDNFHKTNQNYRSWKRELLRRDFKGAKDVMLEARRELANMADEVAADMPE